MINEKYTICWSKLIHLYNKENIGELSQRRLAELFKVSTVLISTGQTKGIGLKTIKRRYEKIYNEHFKDIISLDNLLSLQK